MQLGHPTQKKCNWLPEQAKFMQLGQNILVLQVNRAELAVNL